MSNKNMDENAAWTALGLSSGAAAQTAPPAENAAPTAANAVMLTVFLKHDQSRPLSELNAQLQRQGYYKAFPPEGVEVVSWYVMMGVGQVVTLRLPASRLREVNRILENTAWGSYRTEFYSTYDYKAIGIAAHEKRSSGAEQFRSAPDGSAEPGNLLLGHDALDVLGLALDTIARTAVRLDRQAGNDGVDATFLRRGAALRALLLVMNVVIDRVVMGHRRSFR